MASPRISATDSSLTGGAPGIMAFGAGIADNWSGGDNVSSGLTYSVGGTISGLTAPVVLDNNAGDATTVSADGSFTFPTQLASGAAYKVTVQTNPTGQTCTVADGSGSIARPTYQRLGDLHHHIGGHGHRRLQPRRRQPGAGLDRHERRRTGHLVPAGHGHDHQHSGDIRTGEYYASDQYSQIEITSTQLSGGQWVGAAVRAQNSGQNPTWASTSGTTATLL